MTFLLIVEDELPIRELVSFVCEREGFEVVGAADVGEACAALKARRPDLILLDRMLPDRSGQSWLEDLKKDPETVDLPVIMLTARGEERDRVEALDAGADDYIVKPFFRANSSPASGRCCVARARRRPAWSDATKTSFAAAPSS